MAWHRPDDLTIKQGENFEYTNAGAHATRFNGKAGLPVFVGTIDGQGSWRSVHKHKGLQPMSKPEFIWRDDPAPVPINDLDDIVSDLQRYGGSPDPRVIPILQAVAGLNDSLKQMLRIETDIARIVIALGELREVIDG